MVREVLEIGWMEQITKKIKDILNIRTSTSCSSPEARDRSRSEEIALKFGIAYINKLTKIQPEEATTYMI